MAPTVAVIFFLAFAFTAFNADAASNSFAFARVESCSGCRLSRLSDVKQFIFEDLPNYNNVEFKHIPGAVPELLLFNENEEEMERLPLSTLTREECNNLLISKGFAKRIAKDEVVQSVIEAQNSKQCRNLWMHELLSFLVPHFHIDDGALYSVPAELQSVIQLLDP